MRVLVHIVLDFEEAMEATKDSADVRTVEETATKGLSLRWPPPGLERLQGDVWNSVRSGTLAALILVFPLLLSVSLEQQFWSLGPLGSAWWVILVTTGVGVGLLVETFVTLMRLFRRAGHAVDRGYDWNTVAQVACDERRDTGFLLQGARWYSMMRQERRERVARLRLVGAALHIAAILWLSTGFAVAVLLASRGALTPTGVAFATLGPAAICMLCALFVRMAEGNLVRRARRDWFNLPWAKELEVSEVEAWQRGLAGENEPAGTVSRTSHARILRLSASGVGVIGILSVLPPVTLTPTSAIGPIMASVAIPNFGQTQARAARAEAFRPYRLPTGNSVVPREAGELLQTLMHVGRRSGSVLGETPPKERHVDPWFPVPDDMGGPTGLDPRQWAEELLPRVADFSPDERSYLATISSHAAHDDFTRLATAAELDVMAGRWSIPFDGVNMGTLPVPRYNQLTLGAYAHVGRAIHELALGDASRAEVTIREVLSLGFLLADDGPTLIDNLIGFSLVNIGSNALDAFYETTGRASDGAALRQARGAAIRAANVLTHGNAETVESSVAELPKIAASPGALRGLRWELFTLTNTIAPCINLHRIVFGPNQDYREWVEEVRGSLVRWPSEEAFFDLALEGYFGGTTDSGPDNLFTRILGVAMGGKGTPGSCSAVFQRLSAVR